MFLKLALIAWCATATPALLTQDELEVVLSTLRLLGVGGCVLLGEGGQEEVKRLSREFVLGGVMGEKRMGEFLGRLKPPDAAIGVVMKVDKPSMVKGLLTENLKRLHWFVWFLISSDDLPPDIRIPANSQFFQLIKALDGTHRLIEHYHFKNSSSTNDFALWSPARGLHARSPNPYRRRTDFQGAQLELTLCHKHDFEEQLKIFWMDFARILNFSLKMEPQRLNKTAEGYILLQDPDGSNCVWGITGLDFDREWVVFHTRIVVKLAIKSRGSNDIGWRAYVQPFKLDMWKAIGAWLFLSTLAISVATGCSRKSFYENVFTAFFCLCNSDPMTVHPAGEPVPLATKLVYLMALTTPAVLLPAYSAYVLSTLSIVRPLEPFRDLKGLIADSTYRVTAVDNTFAIRYLRGTADPDMKYVYRHLFVGADNAPLSYSAMFQELCDDGQLAGLYPNMGSFRRSFRCRMFIMPQDLIIISSGVLFPKGSPLRKLFSERYNEHYEKGTLRPLSKKVGHSYESFGEENEELRPLDLLQTGPILVVVPLGLVLSLAVVAVEVAAKRRTERIGRMQRKLIDEKRMFEL